MPWPHPKVGGDGVYWSMLVVLADALQRALASCCPTR